MVLRALIAASLASLGLAARAVSKVHLALSSDPSRMFVQWMSAQGPVNGGTPQVQWGTSSGALTNTAAASNWTWIDAASQTARTNNIATLTGLVPAAVYYYRVGDPVDGWSAVLRFVATRSAANISTAKPLTIAWIGDLGLTNGQALPYLQAEVAKGVYDFVTHVGDYAYDLNSNGGSTGDSFQDMIEPVTSTVPYMGNEGNHESASAFQHYSERFRVFAGDNSSGATPPISGLTGGPNNHWYSYDVGSVHFIAMSTEAYFYYAGAAAQYAWLEADLAAVDRRATPWVIVYGHRSIYCSCDADCDGDATTVRAGKGGAYGMEALLMKHGVDLWINGHEHNYERNYAVYNHQQRGAATSGAPGGNATHPEVLVDPTAPVYIIEGCAGDRENHEPFTRAQPAYSAFRSNTYGYSRMTVLNATALLWEQIQTDSGQPKTTGSVIDAMLLVQHAHGPFTP